MKDYSGSCQLNTNQTDCTFVRGMPFTHKKEMEACDCSELGASFHIQRTSNTREIHLINAQRVSTCVFRHVYTICV